MLNAALRFHCRVIYCCPTSWQLRRAFESTTFSDPPGPPPAIRSHQTRQNARPDRSQNRRHHRATPPHPGVKPEVDEGYRGLANDFPDQVTPPPRKPREDAGEGDKRAWREARRRQSSRRIVVEHTNAELKQWHPCGATPDAAQPTPRPIWRSPPSSPTAQPAGRSATGTAPTSCSPDKPPADHPPAKTARRACPDLNYSRRRKLAAQCRAERMICMPLGHMAEPAA